MPGRGTSLLRSIHVPHARQLDCEAREEAIYLDDYMYRAVWSIG
jgi:hypothetical protein